MCTSTPCWRASSCICARKPAAFRVIDTHAGAGRYDLSGAEPAAAANGATASSGSGSAALPAERAASARALPRCRRRAQSRRTLGIYPGSPLIAQSLLRPQDRLIACELEPRSAASLAAALRGDRRAKALAIDGWTALGAYVPPKERRGLVLVDPPFEEAADFVRLAGALAAAHRKWPTGIYMLWYPIKERAAPDALARRLQRLGGRRSFCAARSRWGRRARTPVSSAPG